MPGLSRHRRPLALCVSFGFLFGARMYGQEAAPAASLDAAPQQQEQAQADHAHMAMGPGASRLLPFRCCAGLARIREHRVLKSERTLHRIFERTSGAIGLRARVCDTDFSRRRLELCRQQLDARNIASVVHPLSPLFLLLRRCQGGFRCRKLESGGLQHGFGLAQLVQRWLDDHQMGGGLLRQAPLRSALVSMAHREGHACGQRPFVVGLINKWPGPRSMSGSGARSQLEG